VNWHEYFIINKLNEIKKYKGMQNMKKILETLALSVFVVLVTATFGVAEYAATSLSDFPYFQLGCLVVGGMTIISLRHKYQKMYTGELVTVFCLYTMLIALFTAPVINAIKTAVS
jgi:FtsH-binding integral membrane protein